MLGACEHDPLSPCLQQAIGSEICFSEPPPALTAVVDAAIALFAQLLPLQDLGSTMRIVSQMLDCINSPKLEKNLGRKSAASINTIVALVLTLRQAMASQLRRTRETLGNPQVTTLLTPFLKASLV